MPFSPRRSLGGGGPLLLWCGFLALRKRGGDRVGRSAKMPPALEKNPPPPLEPSRPLQRQLFVLTYCAYERSRRTYHAIPYSSARPCSSCMPAGIDDNPIGCVVLPTQNWTTRKAHPLPTSKSTTKIRKKGEKHPTLPLFFYLRDKNVPFFPLFLM